MDRKREGSTLYNDGNEMYINCYNTTNTLIWQRKEPREVAKRYWILEILINPALIKFNINGNGWCLKGINIKAIVLIF